MHLLPSALLSAMVLCGESVFLKVLPLPIGVRVSAVLQFHMDESLFGLARFHDIPIFKINLN